MHPDDFFQLGKIVRTHGIKGHLVIHLDAHHPQHYKKCKAIFFLINGAYQKFTVKEISITGDTARVLFNEIDSLTKAEDYVKLEVFLPLTELPPLSTNEYYNHDLIGAEIIDTALGSLGIIKDVIELPAHAVAQIFIDNKEVLVPLTATFILKFDKEKNHLHMNLPNGLVDVFLG